MKEKNKENSNQYITKKPKVKYLYKDYHVCVKNKIKLYINISGLEIITTIVF